MSSCQTTHIEYRHTHTHTHTHTYTCALAHKFGHVYTRVHMHRKLLSQTIRDITCTHTGTHTHTRKEVTLGKYNQTTNKMAPILRVITAGGTADCSECSENLAAISFEVVTQMSARYSSNHLRCLFSLRPSDASECYSRTHR